MHTHAQRTDAHAHILSTRAHTPVHVHHTTRCAPHRVWVGLLSAFLPRFRLCCSAWLYLVLFLCFLCHSVNMPRVVLHLTAYEHWVVSSFVTNGATMKILTHALVKRVLHYYLGRRFWATKYSFVQFLQILPTSFTKWL